MKQLSGKEKELLDKIEQAILDEMLVAKDGELIPLKNSQRLIQAKLNKKDEFYTQYDTIKKEIESYSIETWQDKIVYCPCDKDGSSQFLEYFEDHFYELGLKELHGTYLAEDGKNSWHYVFNRRELTYETLLNGNGDFRSNECIEILKKADIVVTNPPFSLFQEFISLLIEHEKQFLVLGQINSVASNNIFSLIKDKKIWLGNTIHQGDIEFDVPDDYELSGTACRVDEDGKKHIRIKGIRWWTNLDRFYKIPPLKLVSRYITTDYPTYDDYNIIEVSKTKDIPLDYEGAMAVPITFLDKFSPEQFEIIDANDCRKSDNVPIKKHGFLRGKIDGKWKYVRIVIKHK